MNNHTARLADTCALLTKNDGSHFRQLADLSPDLLCIIDEDDVFTFVNEACFSILGFTPAEFCGKNYFECLMADDIAVSLSAFKQVRSRHVLPGFINRFHDRSGKQKTLSWTMKLEADSNLIFATANEHTATPVIALAGKENRLDQGEEIAGLGSWKMNLQTNEIVWSDNLYKIYGLDKHTQVTINMYFSMVHPEDMDAASSIWNQARENDKAENVLRLVRPDGKIIYVRQVSHAIRNAKNEIIALSGITQDITLQKENEQKLQASEALYRALMQHSSDLKGIIDLAGNYLYVGENVQSLLGYDASFLIGKNCFEFIHPGDASKVYENLSTVILQKNAKLKPFRFKTVDGKWRWMETTVTNLADDPVINGLVVNSSDITEQKLAQDKNEILSLITRETSNAIVITDQDGYITWVNKAFEKITLYRAEEVIGKKPGAFLQGPATDKSTVYYISKCLQQQMCFDVEILNYNRDHNPFWIHMQCQPLMNEEGEVTRYFAIQSDITERKKLEEQLESEIVKRQKKVTSAVILAQEKERSILSKELHDNVNQVLTTVKLYLEMHLDGVAPGEPLLQKSIVYLNNSINEIRTLTRALAVPVVIDKGLDFALQELVSSVSMAMKVDFTCFGIDRVDLNRNLRLAIYRVAQEHITNIIKHAAASNLKISLTAIGQSISILIIDNGKGFDVNQHRQGIGITNMYNRIETLNGKLEIQSSPGNGCTLLATIPI